MARLKNSRLTRIMTTAAIAAFMVAPGAGHFVASVADTGTPASAEPGHLAPAFSGLASNGEMISLDQFGGKILVLEWTNEGCPYVKKHYQGGAMQASQKSLADDRDVVWISVISSAPGKQGHKSAAEANALTAAHGGAPDYILLDESGDIGRAYSAKTTPHMFVIDGSGIVQYNGAIDDKPSANPASLEGATNYTLAAITAIKAGQQPDPARTRPYGCSVKYGS